jgi:DHA2 family methylenomycin A resistance protein-like MFS transporter
VRRPPIPSFIADVFDDRIARSGLLVGAVALFAAALDPRIWGPSLPSVQAAVRENPELDTVIMLAAVGGSALLLVGGAVGDSARARPIILGGLLVELVASVAGLLLPLGPLFVAARLVGHGAAAFVIPVSLALVATSYHGVARATAIGLAYGAYGAAGAAAPILLQLVTGQSWPAFLAAVAACALAIWIARSRIPELTRPTMPERRYVIDTAIWAFGIISLTIGITWIGGGLDNPVRWALIGGGLAVLGLAMLHDRRRTQGVTGEVRIERRPVAVAVFVGIVLAISQTAPMLQLPLYFHLVLGYGPFLATVALAPLFAALVLAGPVAGFLLVRFSPRSLVGVGVIAVGLANLILWWVATPSAGYLLFVLPCLLIGAGFVVATTVRTAIIFASVPRGLPATAAALNEASIAVGSRIGIVLVTAIVAEVALATYTASVANLPGAEAQDAIATFRDILVAIGTPSFSQVASAISAADVGPYLEAYTTGVRAAFGLGGAAAVVGGTAAWLALGRRDPLATVWEHRDEREPAAG